MLFNSLNFCIFFPIVTTLYFLCPFVWRWALLLTASCYFYMSFVPVYILILALTITVDYWAAIWIEKTTNPRRKWIFQASILVTCLILFVFKYFNFFNANMAGLAQFLGWNYSVGLLNLILPIGLSFHTFQSLSYVIEVYRGNQKAERHFGIYALYVMYYPQLVAGPIERPQALLPQLRRPHEFNYDRVTDGLKLMAWGLFKKVVIADRLKVYVDIVYGNPSDFGGISFILATVFFAFQIFCDFSGYSDMAIGISQVMGIRLMENFNRPYFSQSVGEFWRRWHISLMSWFRDYVYIPLGGSRVSMSRWCLNVLGVFFLSGLWHGANWTYVIWGLLNGFYIIMARFTLPWREKWSALIGLTKHPALHAIIRVAITFGLVCFSWIFFRAQSLGDAVYIVTNLHSGVGDFFRKLITSPAALKADPQLMHAFFVGLPKKEVLFMVGLIACIESIHYFQRKNLLRDIVSRMSPGGRWLVYYGAITVIFIFGVFNRENQFIYFQF